MPLVASPALEAEALRQEVRAAFGRRTYPGDDDLALRQPGGCGDEGEDIARFFRGKDWREVTPASLLEGRQLDLNAFLFFMSPAGFVYYLPAFLLAALEADERFDLGETLAFKLTPPPADDPKVQAWREHFARVVAALTAEEKRAVAHVLEHLAGEHERRGYTTNLPQAALDSYWTRLTSGSSS